MKITKEEKEKIEKQFSALIEKWKSQFTETNPCKEYNYLADIYTKWHGSSLYICGNYKAEYTNRMCDEFEEKFTRLQMKALDKFDLSYMRHTGTWNTLAWSLSLKECLKMIEESVHFHPV